MRKMKDSGIEWIGEMPEEWEVSKIKYFYSCYDGKRRPIDSAERIDGPYPYWGAGNITDSVNDYLFDEELVLLGEDGAPFFDPTRPVAFLVSGKIWVNNHIHVLKPRNICSKFLVYFLNSVDYGTYINGSILNKLTQSNMNNIAFVFPEQATQSRIADFLDDKCGKIDRYIETQRAIIEKLKAYKQAVITENIEKNNKKTISLRHCIINIEQGWSPPAADQVNERLGWSVLSLSAVKHGEFNNDAKKSIDINADIPYILELHNNDFLMTRSNTRELVGDVCIVENCSPRMIFSDLIYRISFKDEISIKYMRYVMLSSYVRQQIQEKAKGSSGTMPKISHKSIKEIYVPLPDAEQQREIVVLLDEICDKIDQAIIRRKIIIDKLTEYKKSLIYEVATGKKEV